MSNLNKIDVPIAVEHKTKLDLSADHITTMRFMSLQPVWYRHCIKKEHVSLSCTSVVRPAPIEVPTFGRLRQNLRGFFVPYRLVFPNWDNFYNDTIASNFNGSSLVSGVPQFTNSDLCNVFFGNNGLSTQVTGPACDFHYNGHYYNLTYLGRQYLKIVESLGYKLLVFDKAGNDVIYNALALLAYARVYVDWYSNSQYLNSADVLQIEQLLKFNDPTSFLTLGSNDIFILLTLVLNAVYDNEDYYVNAWDNPVSPNSGQFTAFTFADPTATGGAYVFTNSNGTPEMAINPNYPQSVGTTYIHEALKKLTDFQKRHALAGARSIDRVLAQYGVVTDNLRQQRSIYVGSQSIDIEIGSVMSTADSSNGVSTSNTGDYAGAGFGTGTKSWDYTPDEEGIFIVISTIIPVGDMVQGYDRNNVHLDKTDFFVPEFDSLGVQAIEKGEVYVSDDGMFVPSNNVTDYRGVFGFSGRYGEYKRPKSFVTGDIRLTNFYAGATSWHLMRMFGDSSFNSDVQNVVHSLSFTRGDDAMQYNRMFQYTFGDYDPFYCFIHFNCAVHAPCKPLFETYEFDSDSKRVPTENGNKLN